MTGIIIVLLAVGLLMILAEAVVPGGVVGAIGGLFLIAGVVVSFYHYGAAKGGWIFAGTLLVVGTILTLGLKILPGTALGRRILLSQRVQGGVHDPDVEEERQRLIGREGQALTDLRPSGRGVIDGKRWDVVTDGSYINRNETFRVVRVEGTRIVVSKA